MSLIPKKGTVYVVDDDEGVRDSLQWLLEGKDYRVRCYDSAETFLSRYDPREVACLIVDIRMGGMTGLELQDRLVERKSPLPIVFITGHGDVPMAVNTMKKGAMDFIQKPFQEEALVNLVERMLEQAKEAFSEFQQSVLDHAEAEETQEFPLLRQNTDPDALVKARDRVKRAEAMAPTHPHPSAKTTTANYVAGPFAAMLDRARDALRSDS